MERENLAIVLTCFNRKEKTQACLKSLLNDQSNIVKRMNIQLYICDDHSTDGTKDMLKTYYPKAEIVDGTGSLFWARGMAKALERAKKEQHDYYLMINDDVVFAENALDIMFDSYWSLENTFAAVSGATKDAETGAYTYGGIITLKCGNKKVDKSVFPQKPCQKCDLANWNCFLMSRELFALVGDIDDYYEHSMADFDYSKRIGQSGGLIYVSNDYVGTCSRNSIEGTWMDKTLCLRKRIELARRPNGIPIKSQIHYWKKYGGAFWPFKVLMPYMRIIGSSILQRLKIR